MSSPFLAGGRATPVAEVVSTLGGLVLDEVPIAQGHVTESASGAALGRLEITVPAVAAWVPTSPRDPLAAYGQELIVRRGFRLPSGETVGWETLTRARIQSSEPDDAWLTVVAESIDARLNPADWIVSYRSTGNVHSQVRQICSGVVPVRLECDDVELPDRTWEQQSSRRDALIEVCDAAGAVPRIINGQLVIVDASTSTTPEFELRSGDGGTVVRVLPEQSTELVPNVVVASSALGLGWDDVQWLVAALSVGIGFGLQEIFGNLVAGLMMLAERPVRIGDIVTVGDVTGTVSKIQARATTVTDFDNKEILIPNKSFITDRVINWTLSNQTTRLLIKVSVPRGTDVGHAQQVLLDVVRANRDVSMEIPPAVLCLGLVDRSLEFEVSAFVDSFDKRRRVQHELNGAIDLALRESGIVG